MTQHVSQNKAVFNFFNHTEGIFYDERKKRFVDFKDMDRMSLMNYEHSDFTSVIYFITKSGVQIYSEIVKESSTNINFIWDNIY